MSQEQIFPRFAGGVKQTEDSTCYRLWMGSRGQGAYIEGTLDEISAVCEYIKRDLEMLVKRKYQPAAEGNGEGA